MTNTCPPVSPLAGEHHALGARFTSYAGWQMPVRYDSELTEHHHVRSTAGIFDLSHMGEIDIIGPGAAAVLDYALVGLFTPVKVGKAKYSLLCDVNGGILDDLVVYRLAEEHFLAVANAANTSTVLHELSSRAVGFDAEIIDRSAMTALIALQGPTAEGVLCSVVSSTVRRSVQELGYYAAIQVSVGSTPVLLARTGYTGEDGFELYLDAADAVAIWRRLLAAGSDYGVVPAGLACRDTLRLEAGMPLYGQELTTETSPYQANLGRTVRLDKQFVGRDALAAIAESGSLSSTLVGLLGTGRRAARSGYPVSTVDGSPLGAVTSGALSPTLGVPIAMAYLETNHIGVGGIVSVDIRGHPEIFHVVPMPFYRGTPRS